MALLRFASSPILANIYLHYVLDLWVYGVERKRLSGEIVYIRYADDFVLGFEYGPEAKVFFEHLRDRLAKFGLGLSEEKSGILRFSRFDPKRSKRFSFLGFDFHWGRSRKGKRIVKRRSNGKKVRGSLKRVKEWLKSHRSLKLRKIRDGINRRLEGHFNYYGVIGNSQAIGSYHMAVQGLCFKWLNRRSQRRSYNWTGFMEHWHTMGFAKPTIREPLRCNPQLTLALVHP